MGLQSPPYQVTGVPQDHGHLHAMATIVPWSPLRWHSPMALSACLSSSVKAAVGTSSHTGSTATVDRLLVGLVGSELEAMPKLEPAWTETWWQQGDTTMGRWAPSTC